MMVLANDPSTKEVETRKHVFKVILHSIVLFKRFAKFEFSVFGCLPSCMYVWVYVCIYVFMYSCMPVLICICMLICMYVYKYVCTCVYKYVHYVCVV